MKKITVRKHRKLIALAVLALVMGWIAAARIIAAYNNSQWTDLSDTLTESAVPSMNINQVEASLEDVLAQYEGLINSGNPANKNRVSDLDKLYQVSANDYAKALALKNSSPNSPLLMDLAQTAADLTSSIFELKDSMITTGDFSRAQLNKSRQDLASAVREIKQVKQELNK